MNKYNLLATAIFLGVGIFTGCSNATPDVVFTGIRNEYKINEFANFCLKNNSQKNIICKICLQVQTEKGDWREVPGDIMANSLNECVERKIGPASGLCEIWDIEKIAEVNTLKIPGKFRLIGYVYSSNKQKSNIRGVFLSNPFVVNR